jgi:hypothetical protein
MITNIEELLAEDFNLRHFIQHTSSDSFYDPKASKKKLLADVMKGIEMWKGHMIEEIIEHYANTKETDIKE